MGDFQLLPLARKAKTYRAEAVVELSAPLWLGPEFLGLVKPARIGGVEVRVALPDFRRGPADVKTVLHQRAQVDWVELLGGRGSEEDRNWPFGGVARWRTGGGIAEFSAHRLLVMPKERLTRAEARRFHAIVDDWVGLLETWIEVVAREDLRRERIRVEQQGKSAVVWLDQGKETDDEFLRGKHRLMVDFGDLPLAVTPSQWGRMLAKASDGTAPPEAHILLRDARRAKNADHFRRSVLDSATAAELGLATLRDAALANSSGNLGDYVRERARQIEGLTRFLELMGKKLPSGIREDIGGPRNKAIHAGIELDGEIAAAALTKAEEVVDLAFPWKRLLR